MCKNYFIETIIKYTDIIYKEGFDMLLVPIKLGHFKFSLYLILIIYFGPNKIFMQF